ncbi:phage tail tip lysozyme [Enterococcus sp. LJL120]
MSQEQTAKEIWDYLTNRGWSKESTAGVLGNMQSESGIIADRWEGDRIGNMSGGYGLVQWTPATKYINWANGRGLPYKAVSSQCERLIWEVANNEQFYHPSMSFKQFTQSTQSPETLADIFIRYYERPANPNQPIRQTQARYWYNKFKESHSTSTEKLESEGIGMFVYWSPRKNSDIRDAYGVWGNKRIYLDTLTKVKHFKNIVKAVTGRECMEWHYDWQYGSEPIALVETFTEFK